MSAAREAPPRVLVVAGSDSGGGAGVQADVKTITALGVHAAAALTAVTIQNTLGVLGVVALAPAAVRAQVEAVLGDIGADVVKTGMLGEIPLIETLADALAALAPSLPRVVDPVMVATSGDRLLPERAVDAVRRLMLPGAVVTPNAPEAEILTGRSVDTLDGQRRAAERLLEAGAAAALVKGGHVPGEVILDVLATPEGERFFEGPRLASPASHGTGCTLASGVAAGLARGLDLGAATGVARAFLVEAIARARPIGRGASPVDHGWPARDPEAYADLLRRFGLL
jgi:hydroxymethylpyrimidine/phosphomethylpyrimidine kinase